MNHLFLVYTVVYMYNAVNVQYVYFLKFLVGNNITLTVLSVCLALIA